MKIKYADKNFRQPTLKIINTANNIIDEYDSMGMKLTLRQLYYQFVARALLSNTVENYNKLGRIISDARIAGLINWDAIEDRTRNLKGNSHWENPGDIIDSCIASYKLDRWEGQDYYVEVWIEKEALLGVISRICQELDVNYFACKGYVSQSEMWRAGRRMYWRSESNKQKPIIVHLGDHDPSGIDMTRDIFERQRMFCRDGYHTRQVTVERIALNMDQIDEFKPPPNFVKLSDTRARDYKVKFGSNSWELDALDPTMLRDLIDKTVTKYRDTNIYNDVLEREKADIETLKNLAKMGRNSEQ